MGDRDRAVVDAAIAWVDRWLAVWPEDRLRAMEVMCKCDYSDPILERLDDLVLAVCDLEASA
jgi:hypothetical protein